MIQSVTISSNSSVVMPAWVAMAISSRAFSPPASAPFKSPLSTEAKGSLVFHSGCFGSEFLDPVEDEERLEIHRLLGPQACRRCRRWRCARGRDEVGRAFVGHLLDEVDDRFLVSVSFHEANGSAACVSIAIPMTSTKTMRMDLFMVFSVWCSDRWGSRTAPGAA